MKGMIKMELQKLKNIIELEREERSFKMQELKHNINSNYVLAKLDLITIENYQDSIDTFNNILIELDNLQKRIIKRNNK